MEIITGAMTALITPFKNGQVDLEKYEINLPFNLVEHFKKITPTFFFVDTNKKLLNSYPGSWIKKDWYTILGENENAK